MIEGQHKENKSIRLIQGKNSDWKELAWVCVGMANAHGGTIFIGLEDNEQNPPQSQQIPDHLIDKVRK